MVVKRWIWTVKNREDTLEWIKFIRRRFNASVAVRVFLPIEGAASNVIVWEEEHESLAECERHSSERKSDPDWDALVTARYSELFIDGHKEIWEAVGLE